jgi:hypothetical protein
MQAVRFCECRFSRVVFGPPVCLVQDCAGVSARCATHMCAFPYRTLAVSTVGASFGGSPEAHGGEPWSPIRAGAGSGSPTRPLPASPTRPVSSGSQLRARTVTHRRAAAIADRAVEAAAAAAGDDSSSDGAGRGGRGRGEEDLARRLGAVSARVSTVLSPRMHVPRRWVTATERQWAQSGRTLLTGRTGEEGNARVTGHTVGFANQVAWVDVVVPARQDATATSPPAADSPYSLRLQQTRGAGGSGAAGFAQSVGVDGGSGVVMPRQPSTSQRKLRTLMTQASAGRAREAQAKAGRPAASAEAAAAAYGGGDLAVLDDDTALLQSLDWEETGNSGTFGHPRCRLAGVTGAASERSQRLWATSPHPSGGASPRRRHGPGSGGRAGATRAPVGLVIVDRPQTASVIDNARETAILSLDTSAVAGVDGDAVTACVDLLHRTVLRGYTAQGGSRGTTAVPGTRRSLHGDS